MIKNEKKQMIRYVACACFIIRAVINIPSIVTLFSVMDVAKSKNSTFGIILAAFLISLEIIGEVLVTVSIALSIPNMAIVGSVMSFASLLIRGVRCKFTIFGATDVEFWTSGLFWIVFWGVMSLSMLLGLNKKNIRKLCFAAGFLELIHFGVILPEQVALIDRYGWLFVCENHTYSVNFDLLPVLLLATGAILFGIILPEMTEKPKKKKTITKQAQGGAESKLEQLGKLNALLEKGYITKEEFDAKKKQIMKAETR